MLENFSELAKAMNPHCIKTAETQSQRGVLKRAFTLCRAQIRKNERTILHGQTFKGPLVEQDYKEGMYQGRVWEGRDGA